MMNDRGVGDGERQAGGTRDKQPYLPDRAHRGPVWGSLIGSTNTLNYGHIVKGQQGER
jgi:hypothetical protein